MFLSGTDARVKYMMITFLCSQGRQIFRGEGPASAQRPQSLCLVIFEI